MEHVNILAASSNGLCHSFTVMHLGLSLQQQQHINADLNQLLAPIYEGPVFYSVTVNVNKLQCWSQNTVEIKMPSLCTKKAFLNI